MRQKLLFLLTALLLLTTGNAWADRVLYSQDYESATDASSWSTSDGGNLPLSLQTASTNKFVRAGTSTNGRYAFTNFFENNASASSTFYNSFTSYTLSFDALLLGSTRQPSELVVMANGHSMPGGVGKRYLMVNKNNYDEGTNKYLLFLQSTDVGNDGSTDAAVYQKFYINQTSTTVTLPKDAWCTFTLKVTPTKVDYTIINKSTSATLQSGSYDIPDGQSNLAQGIFAFLHKQGTSSSGSGGQGGRLDIDNINIRVEPFSATLDHTAGAQWGSNSGASTVDSDKEHYNGDADSGWAGCAYARFSYTIPDGHVITSATLNYTMFQNNNSNQEDHIYYMNKDFDLDWANFAGQTDTDLRNTASRSSSYRTQPTVGQKGGKENVLSVDVTDYVKNIAEQSQDYIIFQWTGNAGGGDLYGKGADAAKRPTLVIETAPAVLVAIEDCKQYDTSAAFATAIDAESFASVTEVYAFNTSYHVANGVLTDGVRDVTGVIRNAQVSDAEATDWAGAGTYSNQQYDGAPDPYFIDNNGSQMWATQWIYGLPAGRYQVKVATRGDVANYNHIYISNGTEDIGRVQGTHVGNTGGELGNGWSWTYVPFTITETTNLIFGFYKDAKNWAGCDDWHLYRVESVSATIGATGWTTFASAYPLDLGGMEASEGDVTAYYASSVADSKIVMTPTTSEGVAAGTGLMLKGTAGATITIPVAISGSPIVGNMLVGCTTETVLTQNANHYLLYNNVGTAEFRPLTGDYSVTVPAGKAYLNAAANNGARLVISLDEADPTAITAIEAAETEGGALKDGKYLIGNKIVLVKNGVKYGANGQKLN